MNYIHNSMPPIEQAKLDAAKTDQAAQAIEQEKQTAILDYIAMMADIEIPIEEDENNEPEI